VSDQTADEEFLLAVLNSTPVVDDVQTDEFADTARTRSWLAAHGGTGSAAELRELPDEELLARLEANKEELFNLRFQMATGQLDNNRRLRTVKHEIARIYTILRERELGLSVAPEENVAS